MAWRFWKSRTERSLTTVEDEPTPAVEPTAEVAEQVQAPPPMDPDAPRLGQFHFEAPASPEDSVVAEASAEAPDLVDTRRLAVTPPAAAPDVREVVREKARRGRRRGLDGTALGVRPILVPSLREMAVIYREGARRRATDRPQEAIGLWQAYLALCPEDGAAWVALGQSLIQANQLEAAWGAFVEARERLPADPLPAGALAYLSEATGDLPGAVGHYEAAVQRAPDDGALLGELARVYELVGRGGEAARLRARQAQQPGEVS